MEKPNIDELKKEAPHSDEGRTKITPDEMTEHLDAMFTILDGLQRGAFEEKYYTDNAGAERVQVVGQKGGIMLDEDVATYLTTKDKATAIRDEIMLSI
ncbi:MAG: hypothetical protein AAB840_02785, partial [Patescibacteria group bacterium]